MLREFRALTGRSPQLVYAQTMNLVEYCAGSSESAKFLSNLAWFRA